MLASQAGIRPTELAPAIYSHRNCDAARHLYRVTAGLDSMIVGEAEIQGQVKRAYDAALARETVGPLTNHLFKAALETGKRVRTETAIGERAAEPAGGRGGARARAARRARRRTVVIVGTGETSELAARALADSGGRPVFVASRRRDRAIRLARRYGGDSISFDELPQALERADIVVAATASPHLLLEAEELAEVMRLRGGRPLLLIDLAVPRDIDAACGEIDGVSLYDIDDLAGGDRAQPQGPPGRGAQGRGDHRGGDPAVRRLARVARGAADAGGAARLTEARSLSRWCARTPANGSRRRSRSRAGRRDRPRDREPAAARAHARGSRSSGTTASTPGWRSSATCSV